MKQRAARSEAPATTTARRAAKYLAQQFTYGRVWMNASTQAASEKTGGISNHPLPTTS